MMKRKVRKSARRVRPTLSPKGLFGFSGVNVNIRGFPILAPKSKAPRYEIGPTKWTLREKYGGELTLNIGHWDDYIKTVKKKGKKKSEESKKKRS